MWQAILGAGRLRRQLRARRSDFDDGYADLWLVTDTAQTIIGQYSGSEGLRQHETLATTLDVAALLIENAATLTH